MTAPLNHHDRAARRAAVLSDRAAGLTPRQLAAKHGMSLAWVYETLQGQDSPRAARALQAHCAIAAALVTGGETETAIAGRLGVGRDTVRRVAAGLAAAGLPLPPRRRGRPKRKES